MDEVEYIAHKHLERDVVGRSYGVGDGRCSTIISISEELSRSFIGWGMGDVPHPHQ